MVKTKTPFNPNVRPVTFKVAAAWLPESSKSPMEMRKLGSDTPFQCYYCHATNTINIMYDNKTGQACEYPINETEWNKVCKIIVEVVASGNNPELTKHYTYPAIKGTGINMNFGVNVPAICRRYNECNPIKPTVDCLFQNNKTRLILKPGIAGRDNYRLRLCTDDFRKYVQGKNINHLLVNFNDDKGFQDIGNLKTYSRGSIQNKSIVSDWITKMEYTNTSFQLSFELEFDYDNQEHRYRFMKKIINA